MGKGSAERQREYRRRREEERANMHRALTEILRRLEGRTGPVAAEIRLLVEEVLR